ncbi:hypothetical protein [Actinocorallia populi]|uniref:hypothetical protein n=1 Tax=Actinocorallia populi TaxID=2079200 RepID=UPI0018E573F6|nr:hypothetical protein [Actinocorallia populi]
MAKTPMDLSARGRRTEAELVMAEDLLHAGADPADLDDEWLLARPMRVRRLLSRS